MKKFLCLLLVFLFTAFPIITYAKEEKATKIILSDLNTMNFKEALVDEEMTLKNTKYEETDNQVIIYLFRGRGCAYCRAFLTFLNDISEEYGEYFKVVSFESWYDEANYNLLSTLSEFMENPAGGVPYIIIGDKVFGGYTESYNDSIKEAIKAEYEKDLEGRYDVIEEYNNSISYHMSDTTKIILWNFVFVGIATGVVILYIKKQNENMLKAIKKVSSSNSEKKVVKKTNAKKK